MSHIRKVTLKVRDLDALAEAGSVCNMELVRNQPKFKWYGRFVGDTAGIPGMDPKDYGKCEHVLRLKNASAYDYEVGVVKAKDGDGYELHFDSWQQNRLMTEVGGLEMDKLRREYAASMAMSQARKKLGPKGFVAKRIDLPGNRIRIQAVKR